MKIRLLLLFIISSVISYAQPRWSPSIRSEREMAWMKDSLHITKQQENKLKPASLSYQQDMDKAPQADGSIKAGRIRHELMRKKDASYKAILNHKQYEKYLDRELVVRQRESIKYPADRQPQ